VPQWWQQFCQQDCQTAVCTSCCCLCLLLPVCCCLHSAWTRLQLRTLTTTGPSHSPSQPVSALSTWPMACSAVERVGCAPRSWVRVRTARHAECAASLALPALARTNGTGAARGSDYSNSEVQIFRFLGLPAWPRVCLPGWRLLPGLVQPTLRQCFE
jgi:hypothetical protein